MQSAQVDCIVSYCPGQLSFCNAYVNYQISSEKKETEIVQRQVQTKEMNAKLCKCIPFTSLEILRTLASFQNLNKSVIQEHILADWK